MEFASSPPMANSPYPKVLDELETWDTTNYDVLWQLRRFCRAYGVNVFLFIRFSGNFSHGPEDGRGFGRSDGSGDVQGSATVEINAVRMRTAFE